MKRTAYLIVEGLTGWTISKEKITCEVVGEMDDKTKVWQNADGQQYGLIKVRGVFFFHKF